MISELKRRLSQDIIERTPRRPKLHDASLPTMGFPQYRALQDSPDDRLCDFRVNHPCPINSPLKDEKLPPIEVLFGGFGEFLETWRSAYLPDFKAEKVPSDMKARVDEFVDAMSLLYVDEELRCREGLRFLNIFFSPHQMMAPAEVSPTNSEHRSSRSHAHYLHGPCSIPCVIVEFKNESSGSIAMPIIELVSYYSHMAIKIREDFPEVLRRSKLPALGITVVGLFIILSILLNIDFIRFYYHIFCLGLH